MKAQDTDKLYRGKVRKVLLTIQDMGGRFERTIMVEGRVGDDGKTRVTKKAMARLMENIPRGHAVRMSGR